MMTLTALLVLPGAIVGLAAQLPLRLVVATSMPVSFGIAAIAGYVYGRIGVPWSLAGYAVATAATAAVVGVVGLVITGVNWMIRRHRARRDARPGASAAYARSADVAVPGRVVRGQHGPPPARVGPTAARTSPRHGGVDGPGGGSFQARRYW